MSATTVTAVNEYVTELMKYVSIENVDVKSEELDDRIHVHILVDENESGILIGHHGDTIASLQRIVNVSFIHDLDGKRVVLNINDYKEKRETIVLAMAQRYVERLKETGEPQVLPYLPANERLIVHVAYKNDPEVETRSEGEGRQRKLILLLRSESQEN